MKDALLQASTEVEKLKTDIMRLEVEGQRTVQEHEMKKLELQREFMESQRKM